MPRKVNPGEISKGTGMANQESVGANAFLDEVIEGQKHGLNAHLKDTQDAHPASAISTTTSGGAYDSDDVQGNLNELSGLVPPRPPTVGNFSKLLAYTGIPDWGRLKLHDAGFVARGDVTSPVPAQPNSDVFVYPEFWKPPFVAGTVYPNQRGGVFDPPGNDPRTDPVFNLDPALTPDPTYTGGGIGQAHQGGFTRNVFPALPFLVETMRIMPSTGGAFTPIVVSGAVYPADRGVLALIHWPAFGDVSDFLALGLEDRCLAAIRLGQGLSDTCDGAPGGVFTEGSADTFPSRMAGQYDLSEIHSGINRITSGAIPGGAVPNAGQVRLGTDPLAGPVIPGGIPILGATSIATGGGNDNNFFRYRVPYLEDYSSTTGLKYTPETERPRFFDKPPVSEDNATDLTQAGNFENFPKDYGHFQIARYRHRFQFLQNSPLPPDPQLQGNYVLLHFKRELDFEAFVRDGVMPDDAFAGYELWGAGLVNYVPQESTDNLIDASLSPVLATSLAYHVGRFAIIEDLHSPVLDVSLTYSFTREVDETMYVSGVQYLLPNGTAQGSNFRIATLNVSFSNLFYNTFRLGESSDPTVVTQGLEHLNPVVLYLGGHTAQDGTLLNGSGAGYTGVDFYQRVEFNYRDLSSVSGPFNLSAPPPPVASADIILTGGDTPIRFGGDGVGPGLSGQVHFWEDAKVRTFVRIPSNQEDPSTFGTTERVLSTPGGKDILFHTTDHAPSYVGTSRYGNFTVGGVGTAPRAGLEDSRKDVEERFLDEVYRFADSALVSIDPTYDLTYFRGNLVGPGLPFPAAPIELPVRVASEPAIGFGQASYLQNQYHLLDLSAAPIQPVQTEAQVCGLPDRSPPVTAGVANPCPFAGRLIYPVTNYTVGYRPSVLDGDITTPQPNYSAITDDERVYLRVFDAAYSNDGSPEPDVIGQPFLTFRIDGLELGDFAYTPGPGPGNSNIAIEVKIPGFTTWMDVGRFDGAGPSKQDPLVDGAGCQINDPTTTFNGRDAVTGTVYSQVKINVGPSANVFANSGVAPAGVAPVLVRVRVKRGSTLDFTQGGPNSDPSVPRALVGITVLRHSDGTGPNDAEPYGPPAFP